MSGGKLTADVVVCRIKDAMKKKHQELDIGNLDHKEYKNFDDNQNKFSQLDTETYVNNLKWNVQTDYHITSHRKFVGCFIVFGKRLLRKFLSWHINPPFDQQREFNGSVTRSVNILSDVVRSLHKQNTELQQQMSDMVQLLHKQNTDLHQQMSDVVQSLDKQNTGLHKQMRDVVQSLDKQNTDLHQQMSDVVQLLDNQNIDLHRQMSDMVESKDKQNTDIHEQILSLSKTLIYLYTEKDIDVALALAVDLYKTTGNQEFKNLIKDINKTQISGEL